QSCSPNQGLKDSQLTPPDNNRGLIDVHSAINNVVAQIGDGDYGSFVKEQPSKDRLCPRNQLDRFKWLGDVIIRSVVEGTRNLNWIIKRCQNHRGGARLL